MFGRKNRQYPRLRIRWPVYAQTAEQTIAGETESISPRGTYVRCSQPLRINEVLDVTINTPDSDRTLTARAEVVWSNRYGYDDELTPRGMGLRFLEISEQDQRYISGLFTEEDEVNKVASEYLDTLTREISGD
jgi:c-di-GMP-binding flagellar brake protein YcgR